MIRPAKPEDAKAIVPLIHMAIGTIANQLAGTQDDEEMLRVLEQFFQKDGNRLSYENVLVAEIDGEVAGFALAYHGSQTGELDQPIVRHLIETTGNEQAALTQEPNEDVSFLLDNIKKTMPRT